jgi:nuclease-like protein
VSDPIHWMLGAVSRTDARARLAERVAHHLRQYLPDDHIVLPRYAPRDRGDRIPIVVVGRQTLFVVEPRDEEGDLLCYQDHWYRRLGPGIAHPVTDSPSLRARRNVARVRSDLGTGGFINISIDAVVVLTRGRPEDVRSSCVPVISGLDPLVRYMLRALAATPAPERTHALADALAQNIKLSLV